MTPAFLDRPAPRWFTIPAHRPFVEDLAQGLYAGLSPLGPDALADTRVLASQADVVVLLVRWRNRHAGGTTGNG